MTRTIIVKSCETCPYNRKHLMSRHCRHPSWRKRMRLYFKTKVFPWWCPLKEGKA